MRCERPNVILIMADDMGYGDLSAINGGRSRTPNLDRLHGESLRFTQAYAASCVCAPSRAGFLTGRYPQRTGCVCLNDLHALDRLDPAETTVADLFRAAGYHTGLIGKWHCGPLPECRPENRGFAEVAAFHPQGCDYFNWTIDENGRQAGAAGRYLTDYLNGRAVRFVRENRHRPFFLHLAHYAPHRPLQPPDEEAVQPFLARGLSRGEATVYAMLEVMDRGIGMLDEELERCGLKENTIVIFTSDNGPDDLEVDGLSPVRFNCGLRGGKYSVHDGGIRVPFLLRHPAATAIGETHNLLHFTDLLPTLAAACGVSLPDLRLDGENRLPLWRGNGGAEAVSGPRFWQWNRYRPQPECNAAMREGDWKLVVPARSGWRDMAAADIAALHAGDFRLTTPAPTPELGEASEPLLFHIADDPAEQHDLAGRYPHRKNDMLASLNRWFREVDAEFQSIYRKRF